jgi:hypothetical protein
VSSRTRRSSNTPEISTRPPSWATMTRSISNDRPISPVSNWETADYDRPISSANTAWVTPRA